MLDTFKFNSQSAINLCWERRECETSILFSIHKPTDSLMPFLLLFSSEWRLAITLTRYKKLLRKTIKQVVENFATPQEIALPIILSMPHNVVTNNQSSMAGWFYFLKRTWSRKGRNLHFQLDTECEKFLDWQVFACQELCSSDEYPG